MSWMMGVGRGGGGAGGGDGRLLPSSAKWFAIIVAVIVSILFTPDIWSLVERPAAGWVGERYSGFWAKAMFWALKLGAYPLVFFGVRLLIALAYLGLSIGAAFRLFGGDR